MEPETDRAPLSGVRVIEVGAFMAAPFATMQLADLGADVVKVENPVGGDPVRGVGPLTAHGESPAFLRLNRNKRSVAVDLKEPDGQRIMWRLLGEADVLVENLRPGALARLGFGYPDVRERNPRIVYASASGWGQDGPLADLPGLDIMAQARSGLMSITGSPGGDPTKVGVPICDLVCALYLAMATLAALRDRERTGVGQFIDVCLLESAVSLEIWEAARYFLTGDSGKPLGSAHQSAAPYQALRSSDGWVTLGAITPKTWRGLCTALGLESLMDHPDYADSGSRHQRRDRLIPEIEGVTRRHTTAELIRTLDAAGVPCAPVADSAAAFSDSHLESRNFFWDAPRPDSAPVRQLGSPMRLSRARTVRRSAGPALGADTDSVLRELGFAPGELAGLRSQGVISGPQTRVGPAEAPAPEGSQR